MTTAINLSLAAIILIGVYSAWQLNLFENAVLLGRCFFAFYLAVGLSEPLVETFQRSFDVPVTYLRAIVSFTVWFLVFVGIERIAQSVVGKDMRKMRFHGFLAIPGKLVTGLASGFLVAGFLSLNMLMVPAIEGAFIQSEARVTADLPGRAAGLYSAFNTSFGGNGPTRKALLKRVRVPAGKEWARTSGGSVSGGRQGNSSGTIATRLERFYNQQRGLDVDLSDVQQRRMPFTGGQSGRR